MEKPTLEKIKEIIAKYKGIDISEVELFVSGEGEERSAKKNKSNTDKTKRESEVNGK